MHAQADLASRQPRTLMADGSGWKAPWVVQRGGGSGMSCHAVQGWHCMFYPLGKTSWVKLGKKVSFIYR